MSSSTYQDKTNQAGVASNDCQPCLVDGSADLRLGRGDLRLANAAQFYLGVGQRDHIVPLSTQAIQILEEIKPLTAIGRYIFPSTRTETRPMSENTVNGALRRLGYEVNEFIGHGFRSMASTLLNESGWTPDAIERQLAHVEGNSVRAAYNYAEHLEERRRMMQWWTDYLDELRGSKE
ncbi:MAG: site-specific integrase [Bacteroidetes Order II. Incertae sedis bacterium]|nr:site-specific integrase [Bacteroidetes Order II. bacterium]